MVNVIIKFILFLLLLPCMVIAQEHFFASKQEQEFFEQMMELYEQGKILKFRESLSKVSNSHVRKTMEWLVAMHGSGETGLNDLLDFYKKNPNFLLKKETAKRIEVLLNATGDVDLARKWFAENTPITTAGAKAELKTLSDTGSIKQKIQRIWLEYDFNHNEERVFLHKYGKFLTNSDYFRKIDSLIWQKKYDEAKKLMRFVDSDQKHLLKTRMAFLQNDLDKELMLKTVHKNLRSDEGLIYSIMHKAADGKDHEKFASYFTQVGSVDNKFLRSKWCNLLNIETRNLLEDGHKQKAYDLSLKLCRSTPSETVDANWLSGWIALRFLHNESLALNHFEKLEKTSKMSLSRSRALYWLARTHEESGRKEEAGNYYHQAADFPLTYYGQLAMERIGRTNIPGFFHEVQINKQEGFKTLRNNKVIAAAYVLSYTKFYHLSHALINYFLDNCHSEAEKQIVIDLVRFDDKKDLALVAAKKASTKKVINLSACYPFYKKSFIEDPALVNAVIRQESLFNPHAVSSAGAVGLMQIMPANISGFAKRVKVKMPGGGSNALTNPELNLRLGSGHIESLKEQFAGSKILSIASYNAGDHRAKDWIKRFGDPRKLNSLDEVIDWVEKIPFGETRNYVQRVLENTQIYRSVLHNKKDLVVLIKEDLGL